jgi:predicted ATPase/DNA-binding SARP family transcriptional activator
METAQPGTRVSLPHYLNPFIGRQTEAADVRRLLAGQRLVTLTGPGGCGKTRLALAVAAQMGNHFGDGICLVELAALADPDLTLATVAAALDLRQQPGYDLTDALIAYLQPRHFLLLLDNCEHLLAACADLAYLLLTACPRLHILATSREALGLSGEAAWLLPPLSLPAAGGEYAAAELAGYDAINLFVERATAVSTTFTLTDQNATAVARLCRFLDGLPLAIELAASRVRHLTVTEILDRLNHSIQLLTGAQRAALPRQQTMRAAIDWSYSLISEQETRLFRRLSVFSGGFTLAAAEAVCSEQYSVSSNQYSVSSNQYSDGAKLDTEHWPLDTDIFDPLAGLVDKSLVVVESRDVETRYRLLEVVRQYAAEKREQAGETAVLCQKHARYYLQLAQTADPYLRSRQRPEWLARLDAEHNNLRQALHWFHEQGQAQEAQALTAALVWFWYFAGRLLEAERWTARAIRYDPAATHPEIRAAALWSRGVMRWLFADFAGALPYLAECVALWRKAPTANPQGVAHGLILYALTLALLRQTDEMDALFAEAVHLFRQVEDTWGLALAYYWHGDAKRYAGDYEALQALSQDSLTYARRTGDEWMVALGLSGLGVAAFLQADYAAARRRFEECLALRQGTGDRWLIAQAYLWLGRVQVDQNDLSAAAHSLPQALVMYQELGDTARVAVACYELGRLAGKQGDAPAARAYWRQGMALAETIGDPEVATRCRQALVALDGAAETVRPAAEPLPLRLVALGAADVYRDGRRLSTADWRTNRSKELLFYLLHHPGQTKEQIGAALWPEAAPEGLRRSLHDTLYRLRQALGSGQWVVYENGRYFFNRALTYRYDVETFSHTLAQAQQEPAQAIAHLQAAIQLVQGEFLAGTAVGDWSLPLREGLRQQYLNALLQLGELLFAGGRLVEAAGVYRQAIAHDNLLESAHRELMRCYLALGRPGEAVQQYQLLVQLLADELGVAPAPETSALFAGHRMEFGG